MMKTLNAFKNIALLTLAMLATSACNKTPLNPLVRYNFSSTEFGSIDAHFCTSPPSAGQQNLKYLFILDHSASNQPAIQTGDVNNTDANGSRRYGPLVQFVNDLSTQTATNLSYGLIDFNDNAQQPQGLSGFTSNANTFITKVTADWIGGGSAMAPAPNDSGFTNYQSAIDLALSMITNDVRDRKFVRDRFRQRRCTGDSLTFGSERHRSSGL
jgi:hypothetical protein